MTYDQAVKMGVELFDNVDELDSCEFAVREFLDALGYRKMKYALTWYRELLMLKLHPPVREGQALLGYQYIRHDVRNEERDEARAELEKVQIELLDLHRNVLHQGQDCDEDCGMAQR